MIYALEPSQHLKVLIYISMKQVHIGNQLWYNAYKAYYNISTDIETLYFPFPNVIKNEIILNYGQLINND